MPRVISAWLRHEPRLLAVEHRRFYHAYLWVYLMLMGLFVVWVPFFTLFNEPRLAFVSGIMALVSVLGVMLHRAHQLTLGLALMMSALTLMAWLSVFCFGLSAGYEYYFFIVMAGIHLAPLAARVRVVTTLMLFMAAVSALMVSPVLHEDGVLSAWVLQSTNLFAVFLMMVTFLWRMLALTEHFERQYLKDASRDELTELLNRRQILRHAEDWWRDGVPCAVLMLDADNFKRVNDLHGHAVGDEVLRHLGRLLTATLRQGDRAGRVGGEEFLVLLPRIGRTEAISVAGRMRSLLAKSPPVFAGTPVPVTVSVGVAISHEVDSLDELMQLADRRLYHAKHNGRDQVVAGGEHEMTGFATPDVSPPPPGNDGGGLGKAEAVEEGARDKEDDRQEKRHHKDSSPFSRTPLVG
ncbi:GGDEF domain-containing protein [Cobetia amphilecti]|uniref:diguanylate cyclase n=1 Tax=Cobetia amphilecti TaxID=1055104 RepID=A0AAP4WX72_9GAMM|nr:diguanylate cyclase [Cobetia amphilecti]MDO6673790.1 diguanylate cyclase [Cobetia amphilecti]